MVLPRLLLIAISPSVFFSATLPPGAPPPQFQLTARELAHLLATIEMALLSLHNDASMRYLKREQVALEVQHGRSIMFR